MAVTELRVEGYRSVKSLELSMKRVNIIVGQNGCGKSNLYQSISLLRSAAEGSLAKTLSEEGGFPSALWAGPRSKGPVRMHLGVTIDDYVYDLEIGLPQLQISAFTLDPFIKSESLRMQTAGRKTTLLDRGTSTCKILRSDGSIESFLMALHHSESAMVQISDPGTYPLLDDLRRKILKWRFYHRFRTDAYSPLRKPQVGVRTYVLSSDGSDLAAALQTIRENGDGLRLDAAVDDAFPGAKLHVESSSGVFEVAMEFPGLERPMRARELSDGTLRYLCLLAALLSPQPAPLLALNEPETSLHTDLLPPLGRLIASAADTSQIWLTTHSSVLCDTLADLCGVVPIGLEKVDGATIRTGRRNTVFSAEDQ